MQNHWRTREEHQNFCPAIRNGASLPWPLAAPKIARSDRRLHWLHKAELARRSAGSKDKDRILFKD